MKKILIIALAAITPLAAKQCCKDNNPHSCEWYNKGACPAGTSEPCEGACLKDHKKTVQPQKPAKIRRHHAKKQHKHHQHHAHAKKNLAAQTH